MAYTYKREDQAYGYDKDTDYSQKMAEAAAAGDYASAARYEQQRNAKIQGEGLTQYRPTSQYTQYLPKQQTQSSDDILDRILNREEFSYDLDGDALYQQYKDQYLQQGKLAMEDTMGQAAALTGGYGNSYAQTVGQQAYNQYLGRLNEAVPELYSLARSRYAQEGNDLWNLYSAYADREAQDYSREIDARNFDYQQSQDNKNSSYNLAMTMLQSGILPSDAVLSGAGISPADAQAIYEKITAPTYSGSGGSTKPEKAIPSGEALAKLAERYKTGGYKAIAGDMAYYERNNMDTDWISYYLSLFDEEEKPSGGYQRGSGGATGGSGRDTNIAVR